MTSPSSLNIRDNNTDKISGEKDQKPSERYSGQADYLYSSKISTKINLEEACEALVSSSLFPISLSSSGRIHYKSNSRLRSKYLKLSHTLDSLGMEVTGHQDYLTENPGPYNTFLLQRALDLFLSTSKLFNDGFDFPVENARIFMRPIALKTQESDKHEIFCPSFRIYIDGSITACLTPLLGFQDLNPFELTQSVTNKSQKNISSILCEKDTHLACIETELSKTSVVQRLRLRKSAMDAEILTFSNTIPLEFLDERLNTYELINNDKLTLSDLARSLLALVERAVTIGSVRKNISWFRPQHRSLTLDQYWFGKPLIYIEDHTSQLLSAKENWKHHEQLVRCVMARTHILKEHDFSEPPVRDLRIFDDYNSFYSEAISLVLSSAKVPESISNEDTYKFSNLTCDIQVLNEAAHHLLVHYSYMSSTIEKCNTTIDIAQAELRNLEFESSFIAAKKFSETSQYFDHILASDHLTTFRNLAYKKIESRKKYLELEEKIASESQNRRLTVIFGIIASAALSPELMQPLIKKYGLASPADEINKLLGIALATAAVIGSLVIIHFASKAVKCLLRKFN